MSIWRVRDEDLPTWVHTSLVMLIVSPFAFFLIVPGVRAVVTATLPPIMGPDFGYWLFGKNTLHGGHAVLAGISLITGGVAFLGVGASFCRWAQKISTIRLTLWAYWTFCVALYFCTLKIVLP